MHKVLPIIVVLTLLNLTPVVSDETTIVTEAGPIVLHADGTWNYTLTPIASTVAGLIEVTIRDAYVYEGKESAVALKIKNLSDYTITRLKLRIVFYDKSGLPFFEKDYLPVLTSTYSSNSPLKPNYSLMYPEVGRIYRVDEIDVEEWDEGNISVDIVELEILGGDLHQDQ